MFQLIVAVISIALVAILAIASIYYGGSAFQRSGIKAQVDAMVNAGQQISGAEALYSLDTGAPVTDATVTGTSAVSTLSTGVNGVTYLSSAPAVPAIASGSTWQVVSMTVGTAPAANYAFLPFATGADKTDACSVVSTSAGGGGTQFFCSTSSGAAGTDGFAFKL